MLLLFFVAILCGAEVHAGARDAAEIDREIQILEKKAKDFMYLESEEQRREKKRAESDLQEFLEKRKKGEREMESARKNYVQSKVKETGDRGYDRYLKELSQENQEQKAHHDQYLKEKQRLEKAEAVYREKVPGYKEVDLSEHE